MDHQFSQKSIQPGTTQTFHKINLGMMQEKFEDSKGVIRSRKLKDRQHNGQNKRDKRTNNDLQNITQKTNQQAT